MTYRIGRRGAFLLLFGGIWVAIGYGLVAIPVSATQAIGLRPLLNLASATVLGWGWLVCGLTACLFAFRSGPAGDRWGFYALIAPASAWGACYGVAAVTYDYPRGFLAGAVYAALVVAVAIVSGWPEPSGQNTGTEAGR